MFREISFKFKSANKSKGVCKVAVAEAIVKGILVSCKGEGSSGFAKAEVKSRGSLAEPVAEIVTTRMASIVRGSLKLFKFHY